MIFRLSVSFILGLLFFKDSDGQISASDTSKIGKVEIIQDERISALLEKNEELNSESKTIPGYRIQIHFGGAREKSTEVKTKFLKAFPEVAAYESYEQPNFKIRVGDFRTRLEAQKFLKELNGNFTSAFIVQDEIQLPALE